METTLEQPEIAGKKPTSVPALGLAIICLGGMITFFAAMGACFFTFAPVDDIMANDPSFQASAFGYKGDDFIGIFGLLKILCFAAIPWGIVYIVGGIYLRQFKLWANRLLCIAVGVAALLSPLFVANVFNMFPPQFEAMFDGMLVYVFVESALPAVALIWFLNSKKIRPHFS